MINKADKPTIERKITLSGDDYGESNIVEVIINGYDYGMNIDYVPEDKREWFLQVFGDILTRVDARARREVREDREKRLRVLCGLEAS